MHAAHRQQRKDVEGLSWLVVDDMTLGLLIGIPAVVVKSNFLGSSSLGGIE